MNAFIALAPDDQIEAMRRVAQSAVASWGFSNAEVELLKYRENAVYKVHDGDFTGALRVHQPGNRPDDVLRSEFQWMDALRSAGMSVPCVIPTREGAEFVTCPLPGLQCSAQVDLFEWIEGNPLGSIEEGVADAAHGAETYRLVGRLAAQVHDQASGWSIPTGFQRPSWDEHGLAGEAPLWGRFWELEAATPSERALLRRCKDVVFAELAKLSKTPDRFSMIHGDLAPENLMVDGDVVKLIDFDDAGFGWHMFELATALYFITGEPYYSQARSALIAGYREERALTDEDLGLLPLFLLARGLTYLGWVHGRPTSETAEEMTPYLLEQVRLHADAFLTRPNEGIADKPPRILG